MIAQFRTFDSLQADSRTLDTAAKRKLLNDLTDALGIGGWSAPECGEGWDVGDDDIESEWSALVKASGDPCISAYRVALLLVTGWERECVTAG